MKNCLKSWNKSFKFLWSNDELNGALTLTWRRRSAAHRFKNTSVNSKWFKLKPYLAVGALLPSSMVFCYRNAPAQRASLSARVHLLTWTAEVSVHAPTRKRCCLLKSAGLRCQTPAAAQSRWWCRSGFWCWGPGRRFPERSDTARPAAQKQESGPKDTHPVEVMK